MSASITALGLNLVLHLAKVLSLLSLRLGLGPNDDLGLVVGLPKHQHLDLEDVVFFLDLVLIESTLLLLLELPYVHLGLGVVFESVEVLLNMSIFSTLQLIPNVSLFLTRLVDFLNSLALPAFSWLATKTVSSGAFSFLSDLSLEVADLLKLPGLVIVAEDDLVRRLFLHHILQLFGVVVEPVEVLLHPVL